MIRRTLALASVVALAAGVTGLAGPASADPGIATTPDFHITEVAAELVDAGATGDIDGGFIQLSNIGSTVDLDGWRVTACDANGDLRTVVTFLTGEEIGPNETILIGDPDFNDPTNGLPDKFFEDANMNPLLQAAGGVELVNGTTPVDDVKWGMLNNTDCANFIDAGLNPEDLQSVNRVVATDAWRLDGVTTTS